MLQPIQPIDKSDTAYTILYRIVFIFNLSFEKRIFQVATRVINLTTY
jgi:hypothetical protein